MTFQLGHSQSGSVVTFDNCDNPHSLVLGRSGTGKSYFIKGLVAQAAQQGAFCLVMDCSSDFRSYSPPNGVSFTRIDISDPTFSINPLAATAAGGGIATAQLLLSALHSVFRMGPRANLSLQNLALNYLQCNGSPTLAGLLEFAQSVEKKGAGLTAAMEPLELLTALIHCSSTPISVDLNRPGIVALGFDKVVDNKLRALLAELILQTTWDQWTTDDHNHPLIIVLDECQNLSWGENSMSIRILREGRKFGIGGWFASQWVANKNAVAALNQAAFQAYFRPDDTNIPALAKKLAQGNTKQVGQWQRLLQGLHIGQFVFSQRNGQTIVVNVPRASI